MYQVNQNLEIHRPKSQYTICKKKVLFCFELILVSNNVRLFIKIDWTIHNQSE